MCNVPVTFGGGSMIVYAGPWPDGLNRPLASHQAYHLVSKLAGSKLFSMAFKSGGLEDGAPGAGPGGKAGNGAGSLPNQGFGFTLEMDATRTAATAWRAWARRTLHSLLVTE